MLLDLFYTKFFYHSIFRASLVPVYAFGENDLYSQAANPEGSKVRKFQNFLTCILGFSPPMFYGRGFFNYTFGLLPYQKPVYTVGKGSFKANPQHYKFMYKCSISSILFNYYFFNNMRSLVVDDTD